VISGDIDFNQVPSGTKAITSILHVSVTKIVPHGEGSTEATKRKVVTLECRTCDFNFKLDIVTLPSNRYWVSAPWGKAART
jgi:hypothetical protein